MKLLRYLFVLFFLINTGCGYTFQGGTSVLPSDVKQVFIPFVENDSTDGTFANLFTEALRDQFERYGIVEITEDRAVADAELLARVKSVKRTTRAVTSKTDVAQQFDTTVTIDAKLVKKNGTQLWANRNLQISSASAATQSGLVSNSVSFSGGLIGAGDLGSLDPRQFAKSQEQTALQKIAEMASVQIYNSAVAADF